MKFILLGGAAAVALMSAAPAAAASQPASATAATATNALLRDWAGPYDGVPPWDKVKPDLFPQAFQAGIDQLLAETDMIANNPQPPTFANTIEAMEKSGRTLDRVQALFGVMTDNMSTPAYRRSTRNGPPNFRLPTTRSI